MNDGTNDYKSGKIGNWGIFADISSEKLSEYISYMKYHDIKNVCINSFHGYKSKNLDFLKDHPFIEGIFVVDDDIDISAIHSLPNLKILILSGDKKHTIDFASFPELQICSISMKFDIRNFEPCKQLRELHLRKFSPKSKDLTEIPAFAKLGHLELVQSAITSFAGVERFPKLKTLEAHYMKNLVSVKELQAVAPHLEELFLHKCPNLQNHHDVTGLQKLNWLRLSNCGDMPSISFIKQMPALRKFAFVGTNVIDGDMSPCLSLEYAGFNNKRHYSHKMEEIKKLLKSVPKA